MSQSERARRIPASFPVRYAGRFPAAILPLLLLLASLAPAACGSLEDPGAGGTNAEEAPPPPPPPPREAPEGSPLATFIDEIPPADVPELDLQTALTLVAMPLSCLDRPHAEGRDRSTYLDEIAVVRRPDYQRERAFYGCWDWHSAVNSTWTMVRIYKEFPELPVAGLVREKLRDHLSAQAMRGETEFFRENSTFERPYGWAWLLALYAELRSWDHPDAGRFANNVQPLAELFSERMAAYLSRVERPSRSGTHSNTAFALAMMLDAAGAVDDVPLQEAIIDASRRLYGDDVACPAGYEPWGADFLSPCLEEAALMAAVLEQDEFVAWFDEFMPAVTSRAFLPLTTPVYMPAVAPPQATENGQGDDGAAAERQADAGASDGRQVAGQAESPPRDEAEDRPGQAEGADERERQRRADEATRELASRSHLIGLAFIRADAMNRIAAALPPGDPRIEAYRRLAALHGSMGFDAMFDADYAGSHWIGTFALKYLLTERDS